MFGYACRDILDAVYIEGDALGGELTSPGFVVDAHSQRCDLLRGELVEHPGEYQLSHEQLLRVDLSGDLAPAEQLTVAHVTEPLQEGKLALILVNEPFVTSKPAHALVKCLHASGYHAAPGHELSAGTLLRRAALARVNRFELSLELIKAPAQVSFLVAAPSVLRQSLEPKLDLRYLRYQRTRVDGAAGYIELIACRSHDLRLELARSSELLLYLLALGILLVAGEVLFQHLLDLVVRPRGYEVDHSVVREREPTNQRFNRALIGAGELFGAEEVQISEYVYKAFLINASPARPTGHLEVLLTCHGPKIDAVELAHRVETDALHREVDPHSKRFGSVKHSYQPTLKEVFNDLFEHRQEAGVVVRHAPRQHAPHVLDTRHAIDAHTVKTPVEVIKDLIALSDSEVVDYLTRLLRLLLTLPAAEHEVEAW
ncbi:MAG: hypothetical protein BWY85_00684 [Firmicutes bacterium ADurb.Bin506]|nr:MAG: hypothetical protein BWY85_00684 [Firmicutes bacterium ADurb.Bin506]